MTQVPPRYTAIPFPSTRNRQIQTDDVEVVPPRTDLHVCLALLPTATALSTANWNSSPHYRYGIDLFNHGYWWEAHAAWEALWHATGHDTEAGRFLQCLIQCAGALFKRSQTTNKGAFVMGQKAVTGFDRFPATYMGIAMHTFAGELLGFLKGDITRPPYIRCQSK